MRKPNEVRTTIKVLSIESGGMLKRTRVLLDINGGHAQEWLGEGDTLNVFTPMVLIVEQPLGPQYRVETEPK